MWERDPHRALETSGKWAACRMKHLLWCEKLQRNKAYWPWKRGICGEDCAQWKLTDILELIIDSQYALLHAFRNQMGVKHPWQSALLISIFMKVHSILAHPNTNNSLNASLFNLTNDFFKQQNYDVTTLNLFDIADDLAVAAKKMYGGNPNSSSYLVNWCSANEQGRRQALCR